MNSFDFGSVRRDNPVHPDPISLDSSLTMTPHARFVPTACPGCHGDIAAPYSRYRSAKPHALFVPLLVAGVAATLALALGLAWAILHFSAPILADWNLLKKEKGLINFVLVVAPTPIVLLFCRIWWRRLHRLPRGFEYECPACRWTGPISVVDTSRPVETAPIEVLERPAEIDDVPAPSDPLEARRDRRNEKMEREASRRRAEEHERTPNPDFQFRDGR